MTALHVPSATYPKIQDALDAAVSGDIVTLQSGHLFSGVGNVDLEIKNDGELTFATSGSGMARIDGGNVSQILRYRALPLPLITKFEARNIEFRRGVGTAPLPGGAAMLYASESISFRECLFKSCRCSAAGGAVTLSFYTDLSGTVALFLDCELEDNEAGTWGGAIDANDASQLSLLNCLFNGNTVVNDGVGGAVSFYNCVHLDANGTTFFGNTTTGGAPGESDKMGGAIYGLITPPLIPTVTVDVANAIFKNNVSGSNLGNDIYIQELLP